MNSYKKLGHPFSVALIVLVFVLALQSVAGREVDKPNVIIIYADDLGSIDANCYGSKYLAHPRDKYRGCKARYWQEINAGK